MRERTFYVYILSSRFRTLYVGVTNDLCRRVLQHRERRAWSYTARYRITILVHFETFSTPSDAIAREKQIKGWRRDRKAALIEAGNPL
jgi:putative endonuclease